MPLRVLLGMDRKFLQRWINGELDPAEENELIWQLEAATEEELETLFPEEEWNNTTPLPVDKNRQDANLVAIHSKMGAAVVPLRAAWWKHSVVKAACVAGLMILGGYFIVKQRIIQPVAQEKKSNWRMIVTKEGVKKMITLADGTRISLNGGSEVSVPDEFPKDRREIRLVRGEIFLDVTKDEQRPFTVLSEKIKVQVLGTSFNVRGYSEEEKTVVAVKTGKVAVQAADTDQQVLLTPGAQVVFDEQTASFSRMSIRETTMIGGWQHNELWYEDDLLKDVIRDLAYNYGIRFEVRDSSVLNKHINATFIKRSKEDVVRILSKMADFKYRVKDADIIIY